jgi:hypothetical protein
MEVGLRENYVPRHNKAGRKATAKRDSISGNLRCNSYIAIKVNSMFLNNKIKGNKLYKDVENRIGTTTCKITECLCRYPPGERLMKKINNAYYDMSYGLKQKRKLFAKVLYLLQISII